MSNTLRTFAQNHPEQASAILRLIRSGNDRKTLTALLGDCTCNNPALVCYCLPEYGEPKRADYQGHTPEIGF